MFLIASLQSDRAMVDRGGPTRALSLLLLAAAAVAVSAQSTEYPPLDGVGNNKANPTWGYGHCTGIAYSISTTRISCHIVFAFLCAATVFAVAPSLQSVYH